MNVPGLGIIILNMNQGWPEAPVLLGKRVLAKLGFSLSSENCSFPDGN